MKVIVFKVGQSPEVKEINGLKKMQEVVGGYIETVMLRNNIVLVCNEDGLSLNLPVNRTIKGITIVGDFFLTKFDGIDDFTDLTDVEISEWIPEKFDKRFEYYKDIAEENYSDSAEDFK